MWTTNCDFGPSVLNQAALLRTTLADHAPRPKWRVVVSDSLVRGTVCVIDGVMHFHPLDWRIVEIMLRHGGKAPSFLDAFDDWFEYTLAKVS